MTGSLLSLILDGVIILLLAGTIYYAWRLSTHIRVFRDSRKDMEKLLGDLAGHIERAEEAIEGLRAGARQSGRDLQAIINDAKGLSEELQIMSESGNSLAGRLEKLADRRGADPYRETPVVFEHRPEPVRREPVKPEPVRKKTAVEELVDPLAGFAIRDPEFDDLQDGMMNEEGLMRGDYEEDTGHDDQFSSEAERDLYMALRGKRKTEAGGVS
ncbi:MAG: hypothetical protein H6869_08705 [Rhodospirillales bacterium]|nr:hypothetical protein [Rhodospirillales bacterium]